jgi:hypothetical protein
MCLGPPFTNRVIAFTMPRAGLSTTLTLEDSGTTCLPHLLAIQPTMSVPLWTEPRTWRDQSCQGHNTFWNGDPEPTGLSQINERNTLVGPAHTQTPLQLLRIGSTRRAKMLFSTYNTLHHGNWSYNYY